VKDEFGAILAAAIYVEQFLDIFVPGFPFQEFPISWGQSKFAKL
jgi:hypothetical protein